MKSPWVRLVAIVALCSAVAVGVSAQAVATLENLGSSTGTNPFSSLILASDGNYYGTTYNGGSNNDGTLFRLTPGGTFTLLHTFVGPDGARPYSALVQGTDGNFYGTTVLGGLGGGTVFKMTPSGAVTTLYKFGGNGAPTLPYGGLVQGSDGNFYGTTSQGGTNGHGTVFQITPSGTVATLYSFSGPDGASSYASMIAGTDGNLYGTTYQGGASNDGTVFRITLAGQLTTLYSFSGSDGSQPYSPLIQGSDGNFYGTTFIGGAYSNGTVFQITPAGALTTLHSFCSPSQCNDGGLPAGGLVQAADGSFYGTAGSGGHYDFGTVFKITSAGTLTPVLSFNGTNGKYPYAALALGANGTLYGTTYKGGSNNLGTVFSLSPTPFQLTAIPPCRLLDTRTGNPIQGGTVQTFDLRQLAQNNCSLDVSTAGLYSLNVALLPLNGQRVRYLTIWPAGQSQPQVATMNSLDGRVKANAAIVTAGVNGKVSIYVTDTANVVLDTNGYFAPTSQSTIAYYPVTPCRVADTRGPIGNLGGPYLQGGHERDFPVSLSNCNIPRNAEAYSLNFTAVPYNQERLSYLTVWPAGQTRPLVSTLNNPTATIVANAAIVPSGIGGAVAVYPTNDTNLVIDIDGYFGPAGTGGLSLYPAAPCRVLDTLDLGSGQPFSGTLSPPVDVVNSNCDVPSVAQAYVLNATAVPTGALNYLTLWPDGGNQPLASTLNAVDGWTASNMAIVPSTNGSIDAYASGLTQLILDLSSYFAP